jgi:hypothetical protein
MRYRRIARRYALMAGDGNIRIEKCNIWEDMELVKIVSLARGSSNSNPKHSGDNL